MQLAYAGVILFNMFLVVLISLSDIIEYDFALLPTRCEILLLPVSYLTFPGTYLLTFNGRFPISFVY